MTDARTTDTVALALDFSDRLIVGAARDVHRAIARRSFAPARRIGGRVPEKAYDAVTLAAYGAVSKGLRGAESLARALGARGVGRPLEATRTGRRTKAVINGLIGDQLRAVDDAHAIVMSLRVDGRDVPATPWALAHAYRDPTSHLVVFLHGLCDSDESWAAAAEGTVAYPERVAAETDGTALLVRYNSGLHVSENGRHLDALVAQIVESWPVPVTRISLVGHSMGGLVARSATNHAVARQQVWADLVGTVVCLGTPHTGASLEKIAHAGSTALRLFDPSRPFAAILDHRSVGIVDLRHGYISAEEWEGQDLTRAWGLDRIAAAPLAHAEYHFVASTLGSTEGHLLGRVFGDAMVHASSAAGVTRDGHVVLGAHLEAVVGAGHLALLNHPRVGERLVEWLTSHTRRAKALPSR